MNCPTCQTELEHKDTFGNVDHCLEAINHPRGRYDRERRPVKHGDIFWCSKCEESYHTLDSDPEIIHEGYPC